MNTVLPPPPAKLAYSVTEAAALVSISSRQGWYLVQRGEWPVRRTGGRVLVLHSTLEAWLRQHS